MRIYVLALQFKTRLSVPVILSFCTDVLRQYHTAYKAKLCN